MGSDEGGCIIECVKNLTLVRLFVRSVFGLFWNGDIAERTQERIEPDLYFKFPSTKSLILVYFKSQYAGVTLNVPLLSLLEWWSASGI
jgi:hypothetical protein